MASKRFTIESVFTAADRMTGPMRRMSARIAQFANRAEKGLSGVSQVMSRVGSGARQVGAVVATGGVLAAGGLAKAVETGAEFEQRLVGAGSRFETPIVRGSKAFERMEELASRLGATTEYTASAAAGGLEFLAKAGESAEVAMGALPGFLDLATAAQLDLARATDIASDALGPMGLATNDAEQKIKNYTRVNDLLSKSANQANLDLEQLFESIVSGSASALGAGQDIESFLAAVDVAANVGIKGSKAGKDIARIFSRLLSGRGLAAQELSKLKLSAVDKTTGKVKDLSVFLKQLQGRLAGMKEGARAGTLIRLFGEDSKAAGEALLSNIPLLEKYESNLRNVEGSTAALAKIQRDTSQGALKELSSAIEAIELAVFSELRTDLLEIVRATTKWIQANQVLISREFRSALTWVRENFDRLVETLKRIGAVVVGFVAVSKGLAVMQTVLAVVGTTATITAGTLGIVAAAVILLIALAAAFVVWWDEIVAAFEAVGDAVASYFMPPIRLAIGIWEAFTYNLRNGSRAFRVAAGFVALMLGPIGLLILAAGYLTAHWDGVKQFFVELWDGIVDVFFQGINAVTEQIERAKKLANDITGIDMFTDVGGDKRMDVLVRRAPGFLDAPTGQAESLEKLAESAVSIDTSLLAGAESIATDAPIMNMPDALTDAAIEPLPPPEPTVSREEKLIEAFKEQTSKLEITLDDPNGLLKIKPSDKAAKDLLINVQHSGAF